MTTFGLHLTTYPPAGDGQSIGTYVRDVSDALEDRDGFSTLWLADHVQHLGPEGPLHPMPESYLVLANVAARTTTVRLGLLATSVLYRNPALLAKMVTTLDVLSDGRAILGIGAAHPRTESEHLAYGYDFPSVGERMSRLDAALTTIRPMIQPDGDAAAPTNRPLPVAAAGVPILVAGSGEQRLLRIAARHADLVNFSFPSGDTLERLPHKIEVLAAHCATVGRDPSAITVTYKGLLSVAPSRSEARAAADHWCGARGIGALDHRAGVFVGEPGDIAEQVQPFLDAGVEHLVLELAGGADPKSIGLAADALAPLQSEEGR